MFKSRFMREVCVCIECDHKYKDPDMVEWKCLKCNGQLRIYTSSIKRAFVRKMAEDVSEYDNVYFREINENYTVLDNRYKNEKYHIALKGYRVIKLEEDEWLDCITGFWDGDFEKLYDEAENPSI